MFINFSSSRAAINKTPKHDTDSTNERPHNNRAVATATLNFAKCITPNLYAIENTFVPTCEKTLINNNKSCANKKR